MPAADAAIFKPLLLAFSHIYSDTALSLSDSGSSPFHTNMWAETVVYGCSTAIRKYLVVLKPGCVDSESASHWKVIAYVWQLCHIIHNVANDAGVEHLTDLLEMCTVLHHIFLFVSSFWCSVISARFACLSVRIFFACSLASYFQYFDPLAPAGPQRPIAAVGSSNRTSCRIRQGHPFFGCKSDKRSDMCEAMNTVITTKTREKTQRSRWNTHSVTRCEQQKKKPPNERACHGKRTLHNEMTTRISRYSNRKSSTNEMPARLRVESGRHHPFHL